MLDRGLAAAAVVRALSRVQAHLGQADRQRLASLVPLIQPDGRLPLGHVLTALYASVSRDLALTSLRQLRGRLAQAATDAGVRIALNVDSQKRAEPKDRWCWFSGDDAAEERLSEYARIEAEPQTTTVPVAQEAFVPVDIVAGKPVIRYFVSYAHKDRRLKDDLLRRLEERLQASNDFQFERWDDSQLLPGEAWASEIQRAIERCHFGLLLVSYAFLNSRYITAHELTRFVSSDQPIGWRRAVPIGLQAMHLDGSVDLKGLAPLQIFRDAGGKFYSERVTDQTKDRFCEELFQAILAVVRRHIVSPDALRPKMQPTVGKKHTADIIARQQREQFLDAALERTKIVAPEGAATDLDKLKEEAQTAGVAGERRDAVDFLMNWASDLKSPSFCALLGESGIGKTTTCRVFTQRLLDARENDPKLPLPIYLDLRHVGESAKERPDLDAILRTALKGSWRVPVSGGEISPADIRRLVEEGALVIFDGLDEVLVHLTAAGGQQFTRELWRILPSARAGRTRRKDEQSEPSRGKLLISCRTHYFRTLRDQKTHLTGEDREGPTRQDYRALALLPFRREQINQYLAAALPDEDLEKLFELISSIHNLPELAERPYTLSLIAEQIPALRQLAQQGRTITGVTLYRHVVKSWLERDIGKHQIEAGHKQRLMEHLAAALWRSGKRAWQVDDVEQWLIDFLWENPRIAAHYTEKSRDVLKEDLRTATFLVRQGEADFRFAHTSLQEFFLASYLYRALRESRPDAWDMPVVSVETLDFLGQLVAEESEAALATLKTIRRQYVCGRSTLALAYGLHAHLRGWPSHSLASSHLDGADLRDWRFEGRPGAPLLLDGASFRGSRLERAVFSNVQLDRVDFTGALITKAEFLTSRARYAHFTQADLTGAIFRQTDLHDSDFQCARTYRTQFLCSQLPNRLPRMPGAVAAPQSASRGIDVVHVQRGRLEICIGHAGAVHACAFAPDSRHIASASADGTLRLWDVKTGELIHTLRGHHDWVVGCSFSPNRRRIASASADGTLRFWDVASGELVHTFSGHQGPVGGCAYAPDGRHLASAGSDGTVRVWDAASGEVVHVLTGHYRSVSGCAYSPNGRRVASAGGDATVRLWNTATGELVQTFRGHRDWVTACAYSPDGHFIASASADGTVRVWDAMSNHTSHTFSGHDGSVTCCSYSPDGGQLASASADGTVRIWDVTTREVVHRLQRHEGSVGACAYSPDGRYLASASGDRTVRMWDVDSGELLQTFRGYEGSVNGCAHAPDGRHFASAHDDRAVRVWDAASGDLVHTLRGHNGSVTASAYAPDGKHLVSASRDGTLRVWGADKGELVHTLRGHEGPVSGCAFAPDGQHLASGGSDGVLRVWNAVRGELVRAIVGREGSVAACAYAPDGRHLASAHDNTYVHVWDVITGDKIERFYGADWVRGCAYAPDGQHLASAGADGKVRVWDTSSSREYALLDHGEWVTACAYSPDGHHLASTSDDGTVRLWDTTRGELSCTLRGHEGPVRGCTFAPDGHHLVSVGDDGTVRIWNAEAGREVMRIQMLPNEQIAVIAPHENRVVGATEDAWRWIAWLAPDPTTGEITRYPAETFGPLPPLGGAKGS